MDDALERVAADAAVEAGGVDATLLGDYLEDLSHASATGSRLDADALARFEALGSRAAERAVPLRALVDLYLSATWRAWRLLPGVRDSGDVASLLDAGEAVLHTSDDALAAAAEGYQAARRWVIRREEAARREFVDDLLAGAADPSRLLSRAEQFGVDIVGRHIVIVCSARRPFRDATPAVARVEEAVAAAAGDGSLVATKEGELVCLLPVTRYEAAANIVATITAAVDHAVTADLGRRRTSHKRGEPAGDGHVRPWRCGVGRIHNGPAGVVRSYEEAKDALKLADLLALPSSVVSITELLVYRVLLRDREAMTDLIENVLTPLQRARGGARPLLETIEAYAATGANAAATARRLHLSVRAVTYRLSRVRQLTGHDPGVPSELYVLHTAVLGARLVGWPSS